MAKQPKRERELGHYVHCEAYLETFLQQRSRPRQRFPMIQEALNEVRKERILLEQEIEEYNKTGSRRYSIRGRRFPVKVVEPQTPQQ